MNGKQMSRLQVLLITGLLVALSVIVIMAYRLNQKTKELASLEQKLTTINRNLVGQQRQTLAVTELLQMFESDEFKKVKLSSVTGKPRAMALVFWNIRTKDIFVSDISLPQPPPYKQYHLWALVDGKPLNAGVLGNAKQIAQRMKPLPAAEGFTISLETTSNSPAPTEIFLAGRP